MKKYSKGYPYLKALLDALIVATPNWMKAPGTFVSSLSEQLKNQGQQENKQLEQEIKSISEDKLQEIIKDAGYEQKEDIELIVGKVKLIPEILRTIDYRFDKVDDKLEEIKGLLLKEQPSLKFPFAPGLNNQTPPEPNFVGRKGMLENITEWYENPEVRIGALIGWGGVGKSTLVRKWYDKLKANNIKPDGIFWWGFYRNAYLEQFLNALLRYVSGGQIEPDTIKSTCEKTDRIKEYISQGAYLIILDGLEEMQKGQASGEQFGCMEHRECADMLKFLADTKGNGLCLITTRYPLTDIKNYEGSVYQNFEVERLSIEDARALFKKVGVKGNQEEMDSVIEEYDGHALSLTLLSRYLVEDFAGDIKKAKEIPPFYSDKEAGGKAHRILLWYDKQLTDQQQVFMKVFSLFRKAVSEQDFEGVFRAKMETKMNQALIAMTDFTFKRMVDNLTDRRLTSKAQDNTFATHPLIKNYFESILDKKDKKLCHKRIYQYMGEYAPQQPETLDEMQPLFEQVYHGCAAGLYDEANDIYWEKIHHGPERYLIAKLGAWGTDFNLVLNFFPQADISEIPLVNKTRDQRYLLNAVGVSLINIGRPKEAEGLLTRAARMHLEDKSWSDASIGYRSYRSLTDLQFRCGKIEEAKVSVNNALRMTLMGKNKFYIVESKIHLGYTLFLSGEIKDAKKLFREADELEKEIGSDARELYSHRGVHYIDFLTSLGKTDEAFKISIRNLSHCIENNWPFHISKCHRCLGGLYRIKGDEKKAEEHIKEALEIARRVGVPHLEIEALIERGRLFLDMEENEDAIRDSNEASKICEWTGFRLYEPDAELILAKAYLAQKDFEQAKSFAQSAYEKAIVMHYRWAEGDAEHLLGEIYLAMGDKARARKQLKKAIFCKKEIIDPKVKESETLFKNLS